MTFLKISAKTPELCASTLCCWLTADAGTVVGISNISGIPAVAVLPSAVDSVMLLLSLLLLLMFWL